jgi:GNAT superfamily N-acetyltransferase
MQSANLLNPPIVIRPMSAADIPAATELSDEQQWPHRAEDWAMFLAMGEGVVAERGGRVVGTTMAWRYGDDMASLGLVIVSPALQGQGIGRRLMEAMIERLGDRSIMLNATEEGRPLYEKLGFVETGVICQHQGLVRDVPLPRLNKGDRVRPAGKADTMLPALYSMASGMERAAQFKALMGHGRTVVHTHEHDPVGFAMLRRFGRGWSIGPVVGSDVDSAKALILHWLAVKQGSFCRLDVTGESGLSPWLESLDLPRVGTVRTMVRGKAPAKAHGAALFAIAAQALG